MNDPSIINLHAALLTRYDGRVQPYGSTWDEEHGFGFIIEGVPATFSTLTDEGALPLNRFEVQIESIPPGDHMFNAEVNLDELLNLTEVFAGPRDRWPS